MSGKWVDGADLVGTRGMRGEKRREFAMSWYRALVMVGVSGGARRGWVPAGGYSGRDDASTSIMFVMFVIS